MAKRSHKGTFVGPIVPSDLRLLEPKKPAEGQADTLGGTTPTTRYNLPAEVVTESEW